MPTNRTRLRRKARVTFTPAVIDCWRRGDTWGLHDALGLAPWEFSPMPHGDAYALPHEQPDTGTAMSESWPKIRALQEQLYQIAGEPGVDD